MAACGQLMRPKSLLQYAAVLALVLNFAVAGRGKDDTNDFWFGGPEIFPIDQQISNLHAADLTGNGLNDLVVADNLKSKIVLLYNQTGKTNAPATTVAEPSSDINQFPVRGSGLIPFPWTSASARWW